jgi:hypothetical protein
MNVPNPGEFSQFCIKNADRDLFPERVELIGKIADGAANLVRMFAGGDKRRIPQYIGLAITKRMELKDTILVKEYEPENLSPETMELAEEILTQYWEFGDAATIWFAQHVRIEPIS